MDQRPSQILSFDEDAHKYTLNGREVPGVSKIIRSAGHGALLAHYATEESRVRGKAVHKAILDEIQGEFDWGVTIPLIRGYLAAWAKFKRQVSFSPYPEFCERPMVNAELFFAGTPDLVGELNGRPALIDVKTGNSTTAALQTAAYSFLDDIRPILQASKKKWNLPTRFDLRLFPNGTYKLRAHDNPNDWLLFVKCLKEYPSNVIDINSDLH